MDAPLVCLASASPRRLQLLRGLGLTVVPCPAGVDEAALPGEPAEARAVRLAAAKAAAALPSAPAETSRPVIVLGADTTVVLDGEVLDKPADDAEAARMLRRLAGRTHEVVTGVHVVRAGSGESASAVERTRVRFRAFGEPTVRWYVATGEPRDKAGAYGIQGLGVLLCEGIEGSWSNVVGLPLERLPELLAALELPFPA